MKISYKSQTTEVQDVYVAERKPWLRGSKGLHMEGIPCP